MASLEEHARRLRAGLNEGKSPFYSKNDLDRFLTIWTDEFDSRAELVRMFANEEIADYLLSFLDPTYPKFMLVVMLGLKPNTSVNPSLTLSLYFKRVSEERRDEVLDTIIDMYRRSGQTIRQRMAKRAKYYFKYCQPENESLEET